MVLGQKGLGDIADGLQVALLHALGLGQAPGRRAEGSLLEVAGVALQSGQEGHNRGELAAEQGLRGLCDELQGLIPQRTQGLARHVRGFVAACRADGARAWKHRLPSAPSERAGTLPPPLSKMHYPGYL
eukprot:2532876-Alexandrium_andersonii.AAC.1